MIQKVFVWILGAILLGSCTTTPPGSKDQQPASIGKLVKLYGNASAKRNKQDRNLTFGSVIYEGDVVMTRANTRLKIKMTDGTELILGDRTTLVIERYGYQKTTREDQAVFRIRQGVFHSKSGRIAKSRPDRFRIKTAFASIGVKGTEFWGGFWENGTFDVALLKGVGVTIGNPAGTVEINDIGWGTTLVSDTIAPTPPKKWGQKKLEKAYSTISWKN